MSKILIKGGTVVARGSSYQADVLVSDGIIANIASTIDAEARAVEALAQLRDKKINQFVVVDAANKVIGVVSMHDLIQAGVN